MHLSPVKYWLLLVCLLGAAYASFVLWRRDTSHERSAVAAHAQTLTPPGKSAPLASFALTDQDGHEFRSESLRGKVWVGSFFFTNCPSVCWRLNQTLAAMQETNPASDARYVSITCDPANDTPAALAKYAQHFKADPARWTFLTGDLELIRRVGNDLFQVAVENQTHSDRAFLVDRNGQVRGRFRLTEPDQVEMLKKLLAEVEAEPAATAERAETSAPAESG